MRIGLFGGSFDPVHAAHVALARLALDELALDRLHWMPAGQPWQKERPLTPAVHRVAMLQHAIAGEPRFVLDRREVDREGLSYTIDSVRELQAEHPGATLFLLIGQDQYAAFHTWAKWPELLDRVTLAVATRPGSVASARADVQQRGHHALPLPPHDVSATDIRQRVAQGLPIDHLVPPAVAAYIVSNGLYAPHPRS